MAWLCKLHELQRGGILGDDMGLGKTMQCSAFLSGAPRETVPKEEKSRFYV